MSLMRLHWKRKVHRVAKDALGTVDEAREAVEDARRAKNYQLLFAGLLWGSVYMLARGLLELTSLDRPVRIAIALVPVPVFIWFLWTWLKSVSDADELQRRIQLEALAFAFPICVVLLMTLGLLELATPLNPDDWSYRHVWAMMPALYFLGLWRAHRRYQ